MESKKKTKRQIFAKIECKNLNKKIEKKLKVQREKTLRIIIKFISKIGGWESNNFKIDS